VDGPPEVDELVLLECPAIRGHGRVEAKGDVRRAALDAPDPSAGVAHGPAALSAQAWRRRLDELGRGVRLRADDAGEDALDREQGELRPVQREGRPGRVEADGKLLEREAEAAQAPARSNPGFRVLEGRERPGQQVRRLQAAERQVELPDHRDVTERQPVGTPPGGAVLDPGQVDRRREALHGGTPLVTFEGRIGRDRGFGGTVAGHVGEVQLEVAGSVTMGSVLDALEARYPMLEGTIRDHVTLRRRPFVRVFACEQDISQEPPDAPLPEPVATGAEPLLIIGALAGG